MTSASCHVLCDRALSNSFKVERGVKQDSVLSPTFFLLVMDPLLKQLEVSGLGLSVNNFYAGGFSHAEDIGTRGLQLISRLISSHGRGRKPCPLCTCDQVNLATSVLEHVLEQHMNTLNLNEMTGLERLISGDINYVFYVFDVCKQLCSMLGVIDEPLNL